MNKFASFVCLMLLISPLRAQNTAQTRLGNTRWASVSNEMMFEWSGAAVAVRALKPSPEEYQNFNRVRSLDSSAWVFQKGFDYVGLALIQPKKFVTVEASTIESAASNLLAGREGMSLRSWEMTGGSLKHGMTPEALFANTSWTSKGEEMLFHYTGKSVAFRPVFPAQKDYTALFLKNSPAENIWIFSKGAGFLGVHLQKNKLITVEGDKLDAVTADITADEPPPFRHTVWKPIKQGF